MTHEVCINKITALIYGVTVQVNTNLNPKNGFCRYIFSIDNRANVKHNLPMP